MTFIRAGYPAYCLAMQDLIALSCIFINHPVCAPVGIGKPMLGKNPIAFCCPTEDKRLLYDISTSTVRGKNFKKLRSQGAQLQKEIGVDEQGNPTNILSNVTGLLPIDGNRGLGMMLIVEL
ncbi:MAG: Ldh family oxidoreductase [Moorea sp. SIO2B7]|nr:Ldh family oxidoreductase [Moorena sp. SIO2B7]